jgi:GNAT superfamily N-acetyltransferase
VDDVTIRYAADDELAATAALRWHWSVLEKNRPALTSREEFTRIFVSWARDHAASHRWVIARRGDEVVGMACLAIVSRVPSPRLLDRASGDLQSVYVAPGERNTGLGGQITTAILSLAGQLGLERVTVHSSPRAVPVYARAGFESSPRLLQAEAPFTSSS